MCCRVAYCLFGAVDVVCVALNVVVTVLVFTGVIVVIIVCHR